MTYEDWRTVRVAAATPVAEGVLELRLVATDDRPLPAWEPGAHLDVETPAGIRQYSLCGPIADDAYTVAVLREENGRGGSKSVHETISTDAELRVSSPKNHFALVPDADRYLLIAGGIGITPIKAMVQHLAAQGNEWELHYGGRSLASMAYREQLQELGGDLVAIHPQDTHGLLDLAGILAEADSGTVVYCCGPTPLLDAVAVAVENSPARELHVERFAAPSTTPVDADAEQGEETFIVELAATGGEVEVGPDQSIMAAVRARGIDVLSSCEDGYCGTCETRVLGGIPLHRDTVLTPSEQDSNETMMICVGRSCSKRLILDL